jgi:hypothetical protein
MPLDVTLRGAEVIWSTANGSPGSLPAPAVDSVVAVSSLDPDVAAVEESEVEVLEVEVLEVDVAAGPESSSVAPQAARMSAPSEISAPVRAACRRSM